MKKIFFTVMIFVLALAACQSTDPQSNIPDMHTTQISVDWHGTYYGEIPSASGSGIVVRLTLNLDETYDLQYQYIERSPDLYAASGRFTWHSDGATITLEGLENYPPYYWVSAGYMIQLDMEGRRITGDLADNYILKKE